MRKFCCWIAIILIFLVVHQEAIQHESVISQFKETRKKTHENVKKVIGDMNLAKLGRDAIHFIIQKGSFKKGLHTFATHALKNSKDYGLDLEGTSASESAMIGRSLRNMLENDQNGITSNEWIAMGLPAKDFADLAEGSQHVSRNLFKMYSNNVGKTGSSTGLLEYPFLLRKICTSGAWIESCVKLGEQAFATGVSILFAILLAGFSVYAAGLSGTTLPPAESSKSAQLAWFARYSDKTEDSMNTNQRKLNGLAAWEPYVGSIVFAIGYIMLEIINMLKTRGNTAWRVMNHRRAWFNHLKELKDDEKVEISDKTLGLENEDKTMKEDLREISLRGGIELLAPTHQDLVDFQQMGKVSNAPNPSGSRSASLFISASIWAMVIMFVTGQKSNGLYGSRQGMGFISYLPMLAFFVIFLAGSYCSRHKFLDKCLFFQNDPKIFGLAGLIVMGILAVTKRNIESALSPLTLDPIQDLKLPSTFDYDPHVTSAVAQRATILSIAWSAILIIGTIYSGSGHGNSIFKYFSSDSARFFTNILAAIQDSYLYWHSYSRYSSTQASTSILNKEMPLWANSFLYSIIVFVLDITALVPIIYDHLSWKKFSRQPKLKYVDFTIIGIGCLGAIYLANKLAVQQNDTKETGKQFNATAFGFSCVMTIIYLLVSLLRDGLNLKSAVFSLFIFGVCVFLYLVASSGMDSDRPIANGFVVSNLNMMRGITYAIVQLQNIIKIAEPKWIYPNGEMTKGTIAWNIVKTFLGWGKDRHFGDPSIGRFLSEKQFGIGKPNLLQENLSKNENAEEKLKAWLFEAEKDAHKVPMNIVDEQLKKKRKRHGDE